MESVTVENVAAGLVHVFYGEGVFSWVVGLDNAQTMLQLVLCIRVKTKPVVPCSIFLRKLLVFDEVSRNTLETTMINA